MNWRRKSLAVALAIALTYMGLLFLEGAGSAAPAHASASTVAVATPAVKAGVLPQTPIATVTTATQRLVTIETSTLAPATTTVSTLANVISVKVGPSNPVSSQNMTAAESVLRQLKPAEASLAAQANTLKAAATAALTAPAADPLTVCDCAGARAAVVRAQARLATAIQNLVTATAAVTPAFTTALLTCALAPKSAACATALRKLAKAEQAVVTASSKLGGAIQNLVNKEIALALCEVKAIFRPKCRHPS
jgi:hypothetical protein